LTQDTREKYKPQKTDWPEHSFYYLKRKKLLPMKNKRLLVILLTVAVILLIPFIAMQFTNEVNWTLFDFVIAGILLLATGFICELAIRKIKNIKYRIAICITVLVIIFLVWADLSVGIFSTPFSGH
jgi:peptidoglycan/LPS O-acetylase OafA/YrhL